MIKTNVLTKKLIGGKMTVYTGFITVKTDKGEYLFSKFSNITRLTKEDAKNDAEWLKNNL
jgi:hypothetical protein